MLQAGVGLPPGDQYQLNKTNNKNKGDNMKSASTYVFVR